MEYYMYNIKVKKLRENLYNINLFDYGKYKKIIFTMDNVISPFGIEKFENKDIINIEFSNHENSNNINNILKEITQFEKFITNITYKKLKYNLPYQFIEQIKDKKFVSCIKTPPNFEPHLRVHIRKNGSHIKTVFFKKNNNNETLYVNPFTIKNIKCKFIVSVENIWITQDCYGIIYMLNLCEVL
jgi:hypothetical protein